MRGGELVADTEMGPSGKEKKNEKWSGEYGPSEEAPALRCPDLLPFKALLDFEKRLCVMLCHDQGDFCRLNLQGELGHVLKA